MLLEITSIAGEPIEPAVLYTSDEELTVAFGFWETHLPTHGTTASDAADEAVQLIERWASGDLKTLVFRNGVGDWCGTCQASSEDLATQIAHGREWLARFAPKTAELRAARRGEWRTFRFAAASPVETLIDREPVDLGTLLKAFDESNDPE